MKSTSTKTKRSHFLLVRIQQLNKRKIFIPIPLFMVTGTLKTAAALAWVADKLYPSWAGKLEKHIKSKHGHKIYFNQQTPRIALKLCITLVDELRKQGKWRMVEVDTGNEQVYIDFF